MYISNSKLHHLLRHDVSKVLYGLLLAPRSPSSSIRLLYTACRFSHFNKIYMHTYIIFARFSMKIEIQCTEMCLYKNLLIFFVSWCNRISCTYGVRFSICDERQRRRRLATTLGKIIQFVWWLAFMCAREKE